MKCHIKIRNWFTFLI